MSGYVTAILAAVTTLIILFGGAHGACLLPGTDGPEAGRLRNGEAAAAQHK